MAFPPIFLSFLSVARPAQGLQVPWVELLPTNGQRDDVVHLIARHIPTLPKTSLAEWLPRQVHKPCTPPVPAVTALMAVRPLVGLSHLGLPDVGPAWSVHGQLLGTRPHRADG